jgi:hypothetical protein
VGHPQAVLAMVWATGPPPDIALPPIYSPRWEKPKGPNSFPENILQDAAIVDARSGGLMSTHASVLVDSVGPPSAEVCRAAASFP